MTQREFNLIHDFVQAMADESVARGVVESKGKFYILVSEEQLNTLLERIANNANVKEEK